MGGNEIKPVTEPASGQADGQYTAFMLALQARSVDEDHATRLVARHPDHAALSQRGVNLDASLQQHLWDELKGLERDCNIRGHDGVPSNVSSAEYWMRRRAVQRHRQWFRIMARLPQRWRKILDADAAVIEARCEAIGCNAIVGAAFRIPKEELIGWLAPLGRSGAERVVKSFASATPPAVEAQKAWRQLYEQCATARQGSAVMSQLGQILLAASFHQIAGPLREEINGVGRSNIAQVLRQLSDVSIAAPMALAAIEDLIDDVFEVGTDEQWRELLPDETQLAPD